MDEGGRDISKKFILRLQQTIKPFLAVSNISSWIFYPPPSPLLKIHLLSSILINIHQIWETALICDEFDILMGGMTSGQNSVVPKLGEEGADGLSGFGCDERRSSSNGV